jgi:hypothetical protein
MVARGINNVSMSPFRFRQQFMEILWRQAEYYAINGDLETASGVDLGGFRSMPRNEMWRETRNIFPKCQTFLDNLGLRYAGQYHLTYGLNAEDW